MDLSKLKEPFDEQDYEWRVNQYSERTNKVMVLCYVTNRAIMDRLDEVCGPESWQNEYKPGPGGGIVCGISILTITGDWVTKWDGAENTNMEAVKGGLSSAMKRAAVQWGIGRHLYKLEFQWMPLKESGKNWFKDKKTGKTGYWDDPILPDWAVRNRNKPAPKPDTAPKEEPQSVTSSSMVPEPQPEEPWERPRNKKKRPDSNDSPKNVFCGYVAERAKEDGWEFNKSSKAVWSVLVAELGKLLVDANPGYDISQINLTMPPGSDMWGQLTETLMIDNRNIQEIING